MRCPRCKLNNDASATHCYSCNAALNESVLLTGQPADKKAKASPVTASPFDEYNPSWLEKKSAETVVNHQAVPLVSEMLEINTPNRNASDASLSIDDLIKDSNPASWSAFAAKNRPIEKASDEVDKPKRPNKPLPPWIGEITIGRLPKKPGYVIFLAENGVNIVKAASILRQVQAGIVDLVIALVGGFLLYAGLTIYRTGTLYFSLAENWWTLLACIAGFNLVYQFLTVGTIGKTFGKKWQRITLITEEGYKPKMIAAIVRAIYSSLLLAAPLLLNYIPSLIVWAIMAVLGLSYLLTVFDRDRRTPPDKSAQIFPVDSTTLIVQGKDF